MEFDKKISDDISILECGYSYVDSIISRYYIYHHENAVIINLCKNSHRHIMKCVYNLEYNVICDDINYNLNLLLGDKKFDFILDADKIKTKNSSIFEIYYQYYKNKKIIASISFLDNISDVDLILKDGANVEMKNIDNINKYITFDRMHIHIFNNNLYDVIIDDKEIYKNK